VDGRTIPNSRLRQSRGWEDTQAACSGESSLMQLN